MLVLIIVLLSLSILMATYYARSNDGTFHLEHWQTIGVLLVIYDLFVVNLAYFIALWLRFDLSYSRIPRNYFSAWLHFAPFYTVFCMILFFALRLYQSIWRFASYVELIRVIISSAVSAVFHAVIITFVFHRMPISYYIVGALFQFLGILSVRFSYRFILLMKKQKSSSSKARRVMIIGAGQAGQMIIRDMKKAPEDRKSVV